MISKKTKYAINALLYLAKNIEKQPISVSEISTEQNISRKFLEAILVELKNAQIVKSKKGKTGGYSLNHPPEKIDLAMIIRLFDGPIALLPCATYQFYEPCEECADERSCGIRQVVIEIKDETVKRLKAATLTDLIKREKKMLKNID